MLGVEADEQEMGVRPTVSPETEGDAAHGGGNERPPTTGSFARPIGVAWVEKMGHNSATSVGRVGGHFVEAASVAGQTVQCLYFLSVP